MKKQSSKVAKQVPQHKFHVKSYKRVVPKYLTLKTKVASFDRFIIITAIASLALRYLIPVNVVTDSSNDDLLGVSLAHNLLAGQWLGTWNGNTLSKPPGYSFFLVIAHFFPVEPTFFLQILYLLLCWVFIRMLPKIFDFSPSRRIVLHRLVFAIMAFNPALLGGDFSRIYRESLNSIAAMAFALAMINLFICIDEFYGIKMERQGSPSLSQVSKKMYKTGAYLGVSYAVMMLTRSEAIWLLYPAVAFIFGFFGYKYYKTAAKDKRAERARFLILGKALAIAIIIFFIPILAVQQANRAYYGVAEVENFFTGQFARTMLLWEGVENGHDSRPFIAVSHGQREAVYNISPTASKLKPYLEGAPNTGWKVYNCSSTGVCNESGAWFVWELRDAAVQHNAITNELQFQAYFKRIADDISRACKTGTLKCRAPGAAPGAINLRYLPKRDLIDTSVKVFTSMLNFESAINVGRPDYGNDPALMVIWHSVVNFKKIVTPNDFQNWLAMGHTVTFLRNVYMTFAGILLLMTFSSFLFTRRTRKHHLQRLVMFFLLAALALFCAGLSVLEISIGFSAGLSLYALAGQPIFMMFLVLGGATFVAHLGEDPSVS